MQGALNNSGLERITGSALSETPTKIVKVDYQAFIDSKKEGSIGKYSNWYDYANEYDLAVKEIEKYNSYYNNEYTTAFNNYADAAKAYSEKQSSLSQPRYDDVEEFAQAVIADFKDNYLFDSKNINYEENQIQSLVQSAVSEQKSIKSSLGTALTAYETAQKAYSQGYYDESGAYVESAVSRLNYLKDNADFRVNEAFRKGEALSETGIGGGGVEYVEPFKVEIDESFTEDFCYRIYFPSDMTADSLISEGYTGNFNTLHTFSANLYDARDSYITSFSKEDVTAVTATEPNENGERTVTVKLSYNEKEYTTSFKWLTYLSLDVPVDYPDSDWEKLLASKNWANYDKVSITIPEGTKELDVGSYLTKYTEVYYKLDESRDFFWDKDFKVLLPKSIPDSVTSYVLDLKKIENKGQTNVEFVRSLLNPKEDDDARNLAVGEKSEKEIMPGVSVVSYRELEHDGDKAWMQSIKFAKKTKVTMPTEYKLDGTYHGGMEGNVEFTNLGSTKMSGTVYGRESLKPIYETFVKNAKDSELPEINLNFYPGNIDTLSTSWKNTGVGGDVNLYGTEVDKLAARYIGKSERISLSLCGAFDATEYLDGDTMYNSDGSHNKKPYELDINTLYVMDIDGALPLKNVYITGDKKSNVSSFVARVVNVRFASDMNGVQFTSSARGVVEFEGEAPSYLAVETNSKVILHNVSYESKSSAAFIELKDSVTQGMANNLKGINSSDPIHLYSKSGVYPTDNNAAVWTTNESWAKPSENARWERAGNQGKIYSEVE